MTSARKILLMEIALGSRPIAPRWPAGVLVRSFDPDADAAAVHALLVRAFAGSAEEIKPFAEWLPWMVTDEEFDQATCFLAEIEGKLAGVALCWNSGFVKDLAVDPDYRRHGLGEALLRHAFGEFFRRGVCLVRLKVDASNPTSAVRLYERVGMRRVPTGSLLSPGVGGGS